MSQSDKYNAIILHELSKDGRIPNVELAEKIGLSPSACLRRVQELENSGLIKGYRAVLNREMQGIGFIAYITVGLKEHTREAQIAFEKEIKYANEVVECHNTTGPFEYLLRVETLDIRTYKTFHSDILGAIPQVNTITTYVVMDSPKDERG